MTYWGEDQTDANDLHWSDRPLRVALAEDEALLRAGLATMLDAHKQFKVAGVVANEKELIAFAHRTVVDVYLIDVMMPLSEGLNVIKHLRNVVPRQPLVLMTDDLLDLNPGRLVSSGAQGLVSRRGSTDDLFRALLLASQRRRFVAPRIAQSLASVMVEEGLESVFDGLSNREFQILTLITQGFTTRELADRLGLSAKTVATYRYRLHEKLGAGNDVELTHVAVMHGLVSPGDCFRRLDNDKVGGP